MRTMLAVDVLVRVTADVLDLSQYVGHVQDDGAGAIATFSGVTRNIFQGQKVIQLEYEAYDDMAEKILRVSFANSSCHAGHSIEP